MPWYIVKRRSSTSSPDTFNRTGLIFQPYNYNGVVYDYETTPTNYLSRIKGITPEGVEDIRTYTSTTTQNSITMLTTTHYSAPIDHRSGFPAICYSKNPLPNSEPLVLSLDKKINGKFKLKNILSDFPYTLAVGCTIPVNVIINQNNFKYMVIGNNSGFTTDFYYKYETPSSHYPAYNYKYIGGYNTPAAVSNNVLNNPADYKVWNITSGSSMTIDFGKTEQILPEIVYNWFIANFERVYENTYTIKSITGSTLTTLTEAPPMTSATLSAVGNAKYLTLKGENNTNYTMEWTSETPQGKIFAGLATSKGGSITIPVGETSTINLTDSTDLYEVWQTYRPPTTTFEIKTYNYSGETSRVDKTDYLTPISTLSGVLRGEASLLNFNVLIQSDTVPIFNYCYIDKFKRYYYVTEPVSVRQNLWEMTMQVDALMTYKDSLLKCEGYIDRNEHIQNKMIIDNNRAIMQGADFEEDTITNELFGSGSFVLSGLRIGTKEK